MIFYLSKSSLKINLKPLKFEEPPTTNTEKPPSDSTDINRIP
ncbi:unnamed protein product, partial [Rotaria sp. Silwood2]